MKSAVLSFPGSNCDRDAQTALETLTGREIPLIWHKETQLPDGLDFLVLPGGFSYGDYLRSGAMAARSPIISAVKAFAESGGYIMGVCNGFQVLCEIGLLPGTLMRNANLKFVCNLQSITRRNTVSVFTKQANSSSLTIPIAHGEGNYFAEDQTLDMLEGDNRIAFTYADNPNGSARNIAGVLSANNRIVGMMPHPERAVGHSEGGRDGEAIFAGLF